MICSVVTSLKSSVSEWLLGAVVVFFIVWLAQALNNFRSQRQKLCDLAAKLPGPDPLPLIGNAMQFACKSEQLLDRIVDAIAPYADLSPMRFWLGPNLHVVVTKPRDIEIVLHSPKAAHKGATYRFLHPFIGRGLITGSGELWRSHRKLIAPMLCPRILECYVESFDRHSRILVNQLKFMVNGPEFDILQYIERCSIGIVCETIMGCSRMDVQANFNEKFIHHVSKMHGIIHNRMMKLWLHPDWLFRFSSGYVEQREAQRVIWDFTEKLVDIEKHEFAAFCRGERNSYGDRKSVLEQLVEAVVPGNRMTDDELRDEIFTLYIASQDTVSVIGSFVFLMLAIHTDVQEKVRREITDACRNEEITADSLSKLKYLEMVVKETLRLFPIAPLMVRYLRGDLQLDTCLLPEGCEVVLAPFFTHRSQQYWEDPTKFIPERFSPEEVAKRHAYTFIPFSGGLMGCIGQKYAMMCLKTLTANVVRNYKITSTVCFEDLKIKTDISIRSVNGYMVSVQSL